MDDNFLNNENVLYSFEKSGPISVNANDNLLSWVKGIDFIFAQMNVYSNSRRADILAHVSKTMKIH